MSTIKRAYTLGYHRGHNDTVEGQFSPPDEWSEEDWIEILKDVDEEKIPVRITSMRDYLKRSLSSKDSVQWYLLRAMGHRDASLSAPEGNEHRRWMRAAALEAVRLHRNRCEIPPE